MKKLLRTALVGTVALGLAAPAFADHQIGGYFRTQFIMEDLSKTKDAKPTTGVDNRLRARWQNNINEYVSTVLFMEVDTPWGEQSKGAIGAGGQKSADGVNIETKHAYLDLKIPETPVAVRLGVQGFGDANFDSAIMNDDMAGLKIGAKFDMVDATLFWSKYTEGNRVKEDDQDLYALQVGLAPMAGLKLAVEGYWLNSKSRRQTTTTTAVAFPVVDANNDGRADTVTTTTTSIVQDKGNLYWLGLKGGYKAGPLDLAAWYVYNFGKNDTQDYDVSAHAAFAKGSFSVAGAKADLRLLWYGKDDDAKDDKSFNQADSSSLNGSGSGAFEYYDAGLMLFLTDMDYNNFAGGRLALTDAAYAGYGLFGAVLTGRYTPPAIKNMYAQAAIGYFTALDDKVNDGPTTREGKSLGTEFAAKVGYKVAGIADVSLRGAYGVLGSFYDKTAANGSDPDDVYKLIAMVNVPY